MGEVHIVRWMLISGLENYETISEAGDSQYIYGPNGEIVKRKRIRRTASEIDRHYNCPFYPCNKAYG